MKMSPEKARNILLDLFPFQPTAEQEHTTVLLARFLVAREPRQTFVLKGYAGTGKTTLVGAMVKALPAIRMRSVLLAPTGRAAKILSGYSKKAAFTIHKKIYRREEKEGNTYFVLNQNLHTDTLFVVDEASMISSSSDLAGDLRAFRDLLEDLVTFVFSGRNCRLLLVGDNAQLPPVGQDISPALDIDFLRRRYFVQIHHSELTEVVRQAKGSGILANATSLRDQLRNGEQGFPDLSTKGFPDIIRISGNELQEELESAYNDYGAEGTMVVCRSNKRANLFNQQIRARIRWLEDELAAGDLLMVVRNNYFWLPEDAQAGFIANGEIVEVMKVVGYRELYGFRFATIMARLINYPEEPELEVHIILDAIHVEAPALSSIRMKKFYHTVSEDYLDELPNRRKRHREIMKNSWFQALQVKFAYAVTCHKAQGGQWPVVFLDQGYVNENMLNTEFLRWLYTAVTRASEKLYLVNFHPDFFTSGDQDQD